MADSEKPEDSLESLGSVSVEVLDSSLLSRKHAAKQRACSRREAFLAALLGVVLVILIALGSKLTSKKQLPPFCLFAVGGGYLEGSESTHQ